jgi:hypothetical protein
MWLWIRELQFSLFHFVKAFQDFRKTWMQLRYQQGNRALEPIEKYMMYWDQSFWSQRIDNFTLQQICARVTFVFRLLPTPVPDLFEI